VQPPQQPVITTPNHPKNKWLLKYNSVSASTTVATAAVAFARAAAAAVAAVFILTRLNAAWQHGHLTGATQYCEQHLLKLVSTSAGFFLQIGCALLFRSYFLVTHE